MVVVVLGVLLISMRLSLVRPAKVDFRHTVGVMGGLNNTEKDVAT